MYKLILTCGETFFIFLYYFLLLQAFVKKFYSNQISLKGYGLQRNISDFTSIGSKRFKFNKNKIKAFIVTQGEKDEK